VTIEKRWSKDKESDRDRLRRLWRGMKSRCGDQKNKAYRLYGGRGITVCNEWDKSFEAFEQWSTGHGYRSDLSIDRVDTNKGYSPENCRWATITQQARNRRNNRRIFAFQEEKTLSEWGEDHRCLVPVKVLADRTLKGWPPEKAMTTPKIPRGEYKSVYVEAFGESKTVKAWSRDPRCQVHDSNLKKRLKRGMPPELAITRPSSYDIGGWKETRR